MMPRLTVNYYAKIRLKLIGRVISRQYSSCFFGTLCKMNNGISADEACRTHSLTAEDFARMCNPDGSLKNQQSTTTFTLKDDPSKSLTVNNNTLYVSAIVLTVVVVGVGVLLIKRWRKRKP